VRCLYLQRIFGFFHTFTAQDDDLHDHDDDGETSRLKWGSFFDNVKGIKTLGKDDNNNDYDYHLRYTHT